MKVSDGFSMADSRNLPKVDFLMLLQYTRENDTLNVAEIRGTKVLMSSRPAYVETSVGYVEVKRENSLCYVKGRVTPEHRVRCKMYTVVAVVNEVEEVIIEIKCEDCAASEGGGCKHAICFAMWLIKRTEEPSVTSVTCYWAKPKLSEAVTQDKCVLAKEIGKRRLPAVMLDPSLRLPVFLEECKNRRLNNSLFTNYNTECETLNKYSIFQIMLAFIQCDQNHTYENFKTYCEEKLSLEVITEIEEQTRGQAECTLWHTLKQGRLSASKIYEATRCKTDGVLVKTILGGYKVPETKAIKRGKLLEKEVLKAIETDLKIKLHPCGFKLITPIIGASPDGVCDNFTLEIKCPSREKTVENYVKDGIVTPKCKAQIQLQMHSFHKKKAMFCVADPMFENNKKYSCHWLYYDKLYIEKLLLEGEMFWKMYIFDKMLNNAKQ